MSGEDRHYYILVHKVHKSAELQISTTSHQLLKQPYRWRQHTIWEHLYLYTNLQGVTLQKIGVFSHHHLYLLAIGITWIHTQQDISTSGLDSFSFAELAQSGKICEDHKWRYQKNKKILKCMTVHVMLVYSLIQPHLSAPNPPKVMLSMSAVLHL
jgi:hypothetical protein